MRKFISVLLVMSLLIGKTEAIMTSKESPILSFIDENPVCQNIQEKDVPTILIPGILASWYSEEGYKETGNQVKRWIPDPITHSYDTLIYTFSKNGYKIKDVFYQDEFTLSTSSSGSKYIGGNPKSGLYVFGYDWKKDNKITATLLTQLVGLILRDYEYHNKCNIGKVNIVAHSMGGLVARAMLEDLCINYELKNGKFEILSFPTKSVNGKIQNFDSYPCKNPYSSSTISKEIKVNKLVTIATPHRGSPKAFAIWEKGDIEMTDGFIQGHALKYALGHTVTDLTFYNQIHGYDSEIPNGIVTIGQLLPDIQNQNKYNEKLKYLYKKYPDDNNISYKELDKTKLYYLNNNHYTKNSFLEELNKNENINKMFSNIENDYILFYSKITGINGENNIVSYDLTTPWYYYEPESRYIELHDQTLKHEGQDIYDLYKKLNDDSKDIYNPYYSIRDIKKDDAGLGGDGTVPTYNLMLVPNDNYDGKEIYNSKYRPKLIDCSQDTYKGFGINTTNEACSHTKMPFITSAKIVDSFAGTYNTNYERKNLINNFGYTNYFLKYHSKDGKIAGIQNHTNLSIYFDSYYNKVNNNLKENEFSLDFPDKMKSYNMYDILSPIDIMITDEQGRRIGIDRDTGMIVNEIPGAWTSGRAGESGEREFFLIPGKAGEPINHKIETNSTGDGEYHIVLSSFDKDGKTTNSGVTIQGSAKLGFSENYEVVSSATGSKYLDLDDGFPLTLDVTKDFKIEADNIDIRYNVKGKGRENIDRISYILKDGQKIKGEEKIDGKIEIPLKEPGKYILELNLLDKYGNILKTENVNIEKIKNEKQEMEVKDILNIIFYKDIDLRLYKNSDFEILTNYDYLITSDQLKQNVTLTNGNGESTKFSIDKDFKYKSDNNNFEIISHNGTSLLFKETINELGIEKIYKYNFIQNRIDEFEIIKGKNSQKTNIRYNNNGNISEIKSKDNSLRFIYDNYTGKLTEISDLYENKIVFTYENLEILDIILNDELFDVNKLDLIRLDYKTIFSLKHKNNLQNIKTKLQSQNLDEKKKQKVIKLLEKSKEKYLKLAKYDITKKEIEYLVEEIKKILENLN